jgi:hypothetical protein
MKHPPSERRAVCVSWSDFTVRALMSSVGWCLRLGHSGGRTISGIMSTITSEVEVKDRQCNLPARDMTDSG